MEDFLKIIPSIGLWKLLEMAILTHPKKLEKSDFNRRIIKT
ncbi:MAG: hypothetical protein AAFY76_10090 [Cyanobacteria bacterium J06649_11]